MPTTADAPPSSDPALWARIVRSPAASPLVRAVLTNSTLVELKADEAVLSCAPRFAAGARARLAEIAGVFHKELGRRVDIRFAEAEQSGDPPAPDIAAPAHAPAASPTDDPLVKIAMELFNARIVSVQPRPAGHAASGREGAEGGDGGGGA